ncbi:MAG TPA: hypothetical protein VL326_34610 [Kofleriaceae bacterium]|nr:hypothetical protein [Kofleriaceae bacterium]
MLLDTTARWLLVLHTALGVVAVGTATHLVIWTRRYLRGAYGKRSAVRRFAWLVLAFQLAAFTAGNLMYPTYKVEVRAAYLENQSAITGEASVHERELSRIAAREGSPGYEAPATRDMVRRATEAARWFDIKEHWVALGLLASAALLLILWRWNPQEDGLDIAPIVSALTWLSAGTIWFAAIVGVLTASWRAV